MDGNGNVGTYRSRGYGAAIGEGGGFGTSISFSPNAKTIGDFGGPFTNALASASGHTNQSTSIKTQIQVLGA